MSGSYMRLNGLSVLWSVLRDIEDGAAAAARELVVEGTEHIAELAERYSPRKTGALENSWIARIDAAGPDRWRGRVMMSRFLHYAAEVHEYEWSRRGPGTVAKGDQAGPQFLARAYADSRAFLIESYKQHLRSRLASAATKGRASSPKRKSR